MLFFEKGMGRSIAFFTLTIGGLLVPIVILWFIVRAAPFPYQRSGPDVLDRPFDNDALAQIYFPNTKTSSVTEVAGAKTVAGVGVKLPEGEARIAAFDDPYTAVLALEGLFEDQNLAEVERTRGGTYTRATGKHHDGTGMEMFAWTEDRWLFQIRSTSRDRLEATVDQLKFLRRRKSASLAEELLGDSFPLLVLGLIGWVILIVPTWARTASWAAVVSPKADKAVDKNELVRRLASLGSAQGPFAISFKGREATLEWRATESPWREGLAQTDATMLERVRFHLDEDDRTVRVIDEEALIDWPPPGPDGTRTPPQLEYSVERAIFFFERRKNTTPGVTVQNGAPTFDPRHRYEFESAELKEPLIEVITQSGWTYRPVFSFRSRMLFG